MKVVDFIKKNKSFLVGLLVVMSFRWSLADQYRVPSGSMEPGIQIGDHIAVNKMAYDLKLPFTNIILQPLSEPQRGDVVVFIWPGDNSTTFVKRLIGIPGDHIQIQNGFITINGKPLEHIDLSYESSRPLNYSEHLGTHHFNVQRFAFKNSGKNQDFYVPEDSYFMMGDNRDNSHDSRAWGFVERKALKGKALSVLWNIRFDEILPKLNLARFLLTLS